jgi:hypothetical protein
VIGVSFSCGHAFMPVRNLINSTIEFLLTFNVNNKAAINQCEMHSGAVLKQTEVTYLLDVRQSRIASLS